MAAGERLGIARGLEACAALAVVRGDDATAARLEGAATTLREVVGQVRSAAAQARFDSLLAAAHHRLGPTAAANLIGEGRRLSTHEAVSYALAAAAAEAPVTPSGHRSGTPAVGERAMRTLGYTHRSSPPGSSRSPT